MALKDQIKSFFKGEVLDDQETLLTYSKDASLFQIKPQLVVAPKDPNDIGELIKFVNQNPDSKLSLTARSGGTDMTGGPINESIILDVTKSLNKVKEVGSDYAIVEPGVYYRDFEEATLEKNLLLPSYPASREICAVGGMVANNSGGEKSLTYGQTKDYVEQLKVILSDGNEYTLSSLSQLELEQKISQGGFEGDIYRKVSELVKGNQELIQSAKPKVSKNSAGYLLWDVWDGQKFNLAKLFAGSQGTLGIITEIKFKLIKPKKYSRLLVIFLSDIKSLAQVVNKVLEYKPESFESFDDKTLKLAIRYIFDFIKILGSNVFSLAWQFLPEIWMTMTGGLPKMILLAEFTSDDLGEVERRALLAEKSIFKLGASTRITTSDLETNKYWAIRRESFNLLRYHIKGKRTAPFIDDVIVKPEHMPEFLPALEQLLKPYGLDYSINGHAGNGNFHIIPLIDIGDPSLAKIITELSPKVYDLVLRYGGSITAEHNDGLIRGPFLEKMYGKEVYNLFKEVKNIFDPNNIFNPGKKISGTFENSMRYIKTG